MRRWWIALGGLTVAIAACRGSPPPATYAQARDVVDRRCVPCHAEHPANRAFPIPPRGIVLETAEELRRNAERVRVRAVVLRTMPLANLSGMTQEERDILASWIESGAPVP